ncbi:MAG: 50S ribosomal protein L25 [Thermonema sp.]|uniref:50S ribosomal protein L25/general stress protein Ctc n=1 Tax=Thermonema sp. TaxID=2231181 RepID=UPI0021DEB134|nr:50S ribosomal protein L25/general stress protein Ctc [Thermonema sp.]GIV40635.1 MAG: 50S ribosomal protein L25 [Thermonema sp.]
MRTVEIVGYKRNELGTAAAKKLRVEGYVPCVLYGGEDVVHFYAPMSLFKDLVYTPEAAFVKLNIEGDEYDAILQEAQFHPVADYITHADFLLLQEDKPVKMEIPVKVVGSSIGVQKGGKAEIKLRKLKVKALPKNMPQYVEVDISHLDLGKSVKVKDLNPESYTILNSPQNPIVSIAIPRALRSKQAQEAAAGK